MSIKSFRMIFLAVAVFFVHPAWAMDDALLAVVNDEAITVKDLQDYLNGIYAQLRIEGRTAAESQEIMAEYQKKGIDQLIEDRLVLFAADKSGVQIRPKAIDERVDEIKKKYPSYENFLTALKHEGMTLSDVRKKIENQFKGQYIVNEEVRSKIYVNPQEVTAYFTEHNDEFTLKPRVYLESIFVKSAYGRDAAKKKIDEAYAKITIGDDFKKVAAEYSELPSVGEVPEDGLRSEFKDKIDALANGQVSSIVEVQDGFYIFKLEGRAMGRKAVLNDVKDAIYQRLFEEKFRTRFNDWIGKLHKKAYVEVKE